MAPITMTPEEFADKQATRLKAAIPDIQRGLERVTEAPTAKAAAKSQKMLSRLTESVQSGKWAARLGAVTLEQWRDKAINKGLPRIAGGIDAARDKQIKFAQQLLPYESNLVSTVAKMPDLTLEDSVARATAWIRGMAKFVAK